MDEPPPSSYSERLSKLMHMCGPPSWTTLFVTAEQVRHAQAVVAAAEAAKDPAGDGSKEVDPGELAWAQKVVDAVIHPDTGKPIPRPFRMNAHVAANTVLLVGMQTATKSPIGAAFWQLANQSFNAGQFYANRNATNTISDEALVRSYVGSVVGSVAIASALTRAFAKAPPGLWASVGRRLVPFLAVALSKPVQLGFMRSDELTDGVMVFAEGQPQGRSVVAGRTAVAQTVASRILYLIPPMVVPGLFMMRARNWKVFKGRPGVQGVVNVAVTALMSAVTTPACMALFPQRAVVSAATLEPQFHHLRGRDGSELSHFSFNKGL